MKRKIDTEKIRQAEAVLKKYRAGKANLDRRIIENERWFKLRHWETLRSAGSADDVKPVSAWLLNCLANKHADAMDNFPQPVLLAREAGDAAAAEQLSGILPAILEINGFEQVYSDMWWKKLKCGTGVLGVFWDSMKLNGLGDIAVRDLDVLKLFWEPGIRHIQDSRNLFYVDMADTDELRARYPFLTECDSDGRGAETGYAADDARDDSGKTRVVDWYYRKDGLLHYVKYAGETVLYATEDDPLLCDTGLYDHGLYPVVFDVQFVEEDSPAGFGYIDVCKSPQAQIDYLNQAVFKKSLMAARPRFFIRGGSGVNEEEYADWNRDFVHLTGAVSPHDIVCPIGADPVDGNTLTVLQNKINELKETGGNRDFSQGGTTAGVTAASAIAALQEAGNKLSRDMIKSSYRAFTGVCEMVLALVRQFYSEPRCFRLTGRDGRRDFVRFDNRCLLPQDDLNGAEGRVPVFDIRVRAEKSNSYTTLAQNELAKEFYTAGFFRPENAAQALACMEMMEFEGKDRVMERIAENGR